MDIFNRPPAISEDTLQYSLYPPPNLCSEVTVTTFAACIQTYVDTLLPNFIWHRDSFELKVVQDPNREGDAWLIQGRMRVGDCVDDEWCTVWLLKEISAKWDVVISVFDTDGDFLLIEAAEVLPSWVKPTNSENRVWIYNSRLHLIPISHLSSPSRKPHRKLSRNKEGNDEDAHNIMSEDSDEYISAKDAISLVRDTSVMTIAPTAVEDIVWLRVSEYPVAAQNHLHSTNAYVPIDIAKSLASNPSLVQKAVETFYTRDALQLRSAHRMLRFPPHSSVLTTVKMTRTAYAQLTGQKFFPPKIFGHWKEPEGTKEWRWRDIGMKIAVGFEMLYQESKTPSNSLPFRVDDVNSMAEAKKEALRRDPEYVKYIQNLVFANYFTGETEGSENWSVLESKAADIFVNVRQQDEAKRPSFAGQVNAAVSNSPLSSFTASPIQEDPDDWLNVDSQNFDAMLELSMSGQKSNVNFSATETYNAGMEEDIEEHLASKQASKLKELATKVENFVEGEGELEGALFSEEEYSDESFSDVESQSDSDSSGESDELTAKRAAMDKLVPGIEPSDYGKMPSYYSNSQRVAPLSMDPDVAKEITAEIVLPETSTPSRTEPRTKPVRKPIIPRDRYDGVDSDDETDMEDGGNDESDEEQPQVVGDIEIDMKEEEEEFLEFSRQALGITDEQWNEIVRDRKERGAFVPATASTASSSKEVMSTERTENSTRALGRTPVLGSKSNANPNLDSFEAVMEAMDAELTRLRQTDKKPTPGQGRAPATQSKAMSNNDDEDIEAALDAELKATLQQEDDDGDDDQTEEATDYNLIKNFLESFRSQGGLSGPVSNLVGRLEPGWQIPRDT